MLGDSITITLGGSGGTDKVLNKINQDGYTSEYLLRETLQEFAVKIQHSKNGARDRHYVEVKQTIFAVDSDSVDSVYTVSNVILAGKAEPVADVVDLQEGLSLFMASANATALIGWQS